MKYINQIVRNKEQIACYPSTSVGRKDFRHLIKAKNILSMRKFVVIVKEKLHWSACGIFHALFECFNKICFAIKRVITKD